MKINFKNILEGDIFLHEFKSAICPNCGKTPDDLLKTLDRITEYISDSLYVYRLEPCETKDHIVRNFGFYILAEGSKVPIVYLGVDKTKNVVNRQESV